LWASQVNLYRARKAAAKAAAEQAGEGADEEDEDAEEDEEELRIDELLDDLELDDPNAPPDEVEGHAAAAEAAVLAPAGGLAPQGFQFTFSPDKGAQGGGH
jgi:hypothetical protein